MSEESRQKISKHKKYQIFSASQKELQQQLSK